MIVEKSVLANKWISTRNFCRRIEICIIFRFKFKSSFLHSYKFFYFNASFFLILQSHCRAQSHLLFPAQWGQIGKLAGACRRSAEVPF
ncbi:unnamed protein product [Citrullus colocynthis]|uniref:Uncharacterized protein n=1 Tax=Citrullus colocynthis TaxID=252529 RepID=A0ABP0YM01_9ROSI